MLENEIQNDMTLHKAVQPARDEKLLAKVKPIRYCKGCVTLPEDR